MNMVRPWSTMVGPWLDHGWTMVSDHGWPWSGNVLTMVEPWLTMVMLNGHHCGPWLTMFRQPWSVLHSKIKWHGLNHGQIPDVQTFKSTHLWGMNMAEPWSTMVDHGLAMFWPWLNHGWPWSGYIREPWSTMVSSTSKIQITWWSIMVKYRHANQHTSGGWTWSTMVDHGLAMFWPWSGYIRQPWSDYGQPWSVPHSKIKWPWSIIVKYLMCRHSNQHTSGGWTWPNHGQPWLTMVWQCCDHGWTMVDHGQVISGNHGLTMVSSTFKNQMTMVSHGQIPDVYTFKSIHLWGMNMAKPWSTVVDHGLAMFWPWLNHGWPWSGYIRQPWSDHGQFHIQKSNDLMVNHGQIQTFKLIRL